MSTSTVDLGRAWQAVRGPLTEWLDDFTPGVFDPDLGIRFADLQATLADAMRDELDLAGYDPFRREAIVLETLTRFRDIVRLAGLADDSTIMAEAQRALGVTQMRVDTAVNTMKLDAVRSKRMDDIAATGTLTWTWKAKLDRRTCAYCVSMHGTSHPVGTPMLSHPNCRCIPTSAMLPSGWAWLRKLSAKDQDFVLHPAVGREWRKGRLTEDDIIDKVKHRRRPLRDIFGAQWRRMLATRRRRMSTTPKRRAS